METQTFPMWLQSIKASYWQVPPRRSSASIRRSWKQNSSGNKQRDGHRGAHVGCWNHVTGGSRAVR